MNQENLPINKLKPFVKWAGGKTQFLEIIDLLLPEEHSRLLEPFVGGGAVFLSVQPSKLIINDLNKELITAYQTLKKQPQELIKLLKEYEKNHCRKSSTLLFMRKMRNEKNLAHSLRNKYIMN